MRISEPSSPPTADRRPPTLSAGFTLLEMMVSVALVLVLMLAVTRIFSIASQTVGASQALSAGTRDAKSAQAVFTRDFGALDPQSPLLSIYSRGTYAYRSAVEIQADRDGDITTVDGDSDGDEDNVPAGSDDVGYASVNSRRHRVDVISFFARDRFSRQTGNQNFIDPLTSNEAFIHYGHAQQPDNSGLFTSARQPGQTDNPAPAAPTYASNPNNAFATQWILARTAMLLSESFPAGVYPRYTGPAPYGPLDFRTGVSTNDDAGDPAYGNLSSRFDVGQTSIATFRSNILPFADPTQTATYNANWWRPAVFRNTGVSPARFFVKPFIARPYNSEGLAYTVPAFVQGCSQFIVEFAGDFVTQNPASGVVLGLGADGVVDFVQPSTTTGGLRQIRWYGHPRKTTPALAPNPTLISANNGDVAPLAATTGGPLSIDKSTTAFVNGVNAATDWSTARVDPSTDYICMVWGPSEMTQRPKMLRITLSIDRPEAQGRLEGGQTFEYVFTLP